jgi:16S rRNA pseudouridine516 synthase
VQVDSQTERDHSRHLAGDDPVVAVDGTAVVVKALAATLLYHKPVGLACSHDEREAPTIYEAVPAAWRHLRLESAGRLDRLTSGLLILTTDGGLIHRLTSPRHHLPKRYRIVYAGDLGTRAVAKVAKGLRLDGDDEPTRPGVLTLEADRTDGLHVATLVIDEGRYHQVRRMVVALGGSVVHLHRDRIGDLDLPADLPVGGMRPATAEDVASVMLARAPHRPS